LQKNVKETEAHGWQDLALCVEGNRKITNGNSSLYLTLVMRRMARWCWAGVGLNLLI